MSGKELFILFTTHAFCELLAIYVLSYFPFVSEGRIWDLIVSVLNHCLSFYFISKYVLDAQDEQTFKRIMIGQDNQWACFTDAMEVAILKTLSV